MLRTVSEGVLKKSEGLGARLGLLPSRGKLCLSPSVRRPVMELSGVIGFPIGVCVSKTGVLG